MCTLKFLFLCARCKIEGCLCCCIIVICVGICRENLERIKLQSRSRLKHRQKPEHYPVFYQAGANGDTVTPRAPSRAPEPSGRIKEPNNLRKNQTVSRVLKPFPPAAALNATAAVKGVKSRLRPSGEDPEDPSVLVSQVLNPECSLHSGKTSQAPDHDTVPLLREVHSSDRSSQMGAEVVPAGPPGGLRPTCLR